MSVSKMDHPFVYAGWVLLCLVSLIVSLLLLLPYYPQLHRLLDFPGLGKCSIRLDRATLGRSLALGTQFLTHNQKPEGNFNYEYDWLLKEQNPGDNQVRQAGAMWGLALIYQDQPDPEIGRAVEKAMAFFDRISEISPNGARRVIYQKARSGSTGTVALCALSYIDYLRAVRNQLSADEYNTYRGHLDGYLQFLIEARNEAGLWHRYYRPSTGQPFGSSSPYADGEALLALVKAAKYLGYDHLRETILHAADAGYRENVRAALRLDPDSSTTKGYYQWSSMAFFEIATSGWPGTEKYADYVIDLADWMIDVHRTLQRTRNTAYAYEGIIHAYGLALQRGDARRARKYACVIDVGLEKLTSWQVGGPIPNRFLRGRPTDDPLAVGGIQNHSREPGLRIDVTQHQMHAVILARRYIYKH